MSISTSLNDLSKLALVASDSAYFTSAHPVLPGSALAPLDEGDPTILPRFDFAAGFFEFRQFPDSPSVPTGFKAIAYERNTPGNPKEVILAFGGSDGGPLANPADWVSNTQHLGWNQWNENRDRIFEYLDSLPPNTKITFTGQSLGGALAQYAAYEWIKSKTTTDPNFDKSQISLITLNALGGYLGLTSHLGTYQASVLDDLGQAAHYVITGDLASRLGGDPTAGIGHVGGQVYLLDYRTVDPNTEAVVKLDLIEGHRIETGFYAGLHAVDAFTVATPLFQTQTPQQWYFQMASLQNTAGLLGNILNGRDVSRAESYPRLLAGFLAGVTFGNQQEWDSLIKAYFTNQYEAGKLSYSEYQIYSEATISATLAGKPVTAAIYTGSVILAGIADALGLGLDAIQKGFRFLKEFLQVSTGPAEPLSMSQGEFSQKAVLALAASGAFSNTNSLRHEFLANNLNSDNFAQQLLSVNGGTWRTDALAYLSDQLSNLADKTQVNGLAVAFYETLSTLPDLQPADLALFAQERDAFITDAGKGFSNALASFTRKFADVAFNVGQTITSFADIRLIDEAYAAELSDPRLSASGRTVLEDARDTFQGAAQTIVVQQGFSANPFNTIGFNPDTASPAAVNMTEGQLKAITINLPFEAGPGGQRLSLTLSGPNAGGFVLRTNGTDLLPQGNAFTLVIPEGQRQLVVGLKSTQDITALSALTVSATLVDAAGQPTHSTQMEATVTLAETGPFFDGTVPTINYGANGLPTEEILLPQTGAWIIERVEAKNYIFQSGQGSYRIYAGPGNDQLYGGPNNDRLSSRNGNDLLQVLGAMTISMGGKTTMCCSAEMATTGFMRT